jgi:hypothetical protein
MVFLKCYKLLNDLGFGHSEIDAGKAYCVIATITVRNYPIIIDCGG